MWPSDRLCTSPTPAVSGVSIGDCRSTSRCLGYARASCETTRVSRAPSRVSCCPTASSPAALSFQRSMRSRRANASEVRAQPVAHIARALEGASARDKTSARACQIRRALACRGYAQAALADARPQVVSVEIGMRVPAVLRWRRALPMGPVLPGDREGAESELEPGEPRQIAQGLPRN